MGQLDGRVAIVTGAGQNIGRAIALRFGQEGAAVAIVDRDAGRGEAVCDEVTAAGGREGSTPSRPPPGVCQVSPGP